MGKAVYCLSRFVYHYADVIFPQTALEFDRPFGQVYSLGFGQIHKDKDHRGRTIQRVEKPGEGSGLAHLARPDLLFDLFFSSQRDHALDQSQ